MMGRRLVKKKKTGQEESMERNGNMKTRLIVCAVIRKNDRTLLGKKPKGKGPYPDTWHIPGGGIDIGDETCEDAVIREIKEEIGITVKNLVKISWDSDTEPDKNNEETYYVFLQFMCDFAGGELAANDDIRELEWVDIRDLNKYKLNRPSKILFKKLGFI